MREPYSSLLPARVLLQVALFAAVLLTLHLARVAPHRLRSTAIAHGQRTIHIEQRLGIFHERELQDFFVRIPQLKLAANAVYAAGHYPFFIVSFVWLFMRRRDHYRLLRDAFLITFLLGYLISVFYPVAPPRYFPQYGFDDTLGHTLHTPHYARHPFAAEPSLHFAGALLVGGGIAWSVRSWPGRLMP